MESKHNDILNQKISEAVLYNYDSTEDYKDARILLGNPNGVINFNGSKHKWAYQFLRNMQNRDWTPQQVNTSVDVNNYPKLTQEEKRLCDLVLAQLITNDSVQTVQLPRILSYITSPAVAAALTRQAYEECVVPDTLVLHKDKGWIRIDELKVGDYILSCDENLEGSFQEVTKMTVKKHVGEMVKIDGVRVSQIVTPNHRVLLKGPDGESLTVEAKELLGRGFAKHRVPLSVKFGSYREGSEETVRTRFDTFEKASSRSVFGVTNGSAVKIEYAPGYREYVLEVTGNEADTSTLGQLCDLEIEPYIYNGPVYCPTVEGSYFVIMHNGKVSVTGNCLHSDSYSVIAEDVCRDTERIYNMVKTEGKEGKDLEDAEALFAKNKSVADMYLRIYKDPDDITVKDIIMVMVANQILEELVFPGGFVSMYTLENKLPGTVKMIQEINVGLLAA